LWYRILQVQWNSADGDYSGPELRAIFGAVAEVEDVLIRASKKKKKGSAIVVMATIRGASAAAASMLGRIENPLLVMPYKKAATVEEAAEDAPQLLRSKPAAPVVRSTPLFPSSSAALGRGPVGRDAFCAKQHQPSPPAAANSFPSAPVGAAHRDYENVTLMKMRKAAERARLAKEIAAEGCGP
jgi:hypothetical protein